MARAYDDDLRRKLLEAYDRGEGTQRELAGQFGVSIGWVEKIAAARKRTGQMERVRHHPGRKRLVQEADAEQVLAWFAQQPDLKIVQVQAKLAEQMQIPMGVSTVGLLLQRLKLRLKKRASTLRSGTRKPTGSAGAGSLKRSAG